DPHTENSVARHAVRAAIRCGLTNHPARTSPPRVLLRSAPASALAPMAGPPTFSALPWWPQGDTHSPLPLPSHSVSDLSAILGRVVPRPVAIGAPSPRCGPLPIRTVAPTSLHRSLQAPNELDAMPTNLPTPSQP